MRYWKGRQVSGARVSARVRANRRNAQFSTGPKTAEGKARSSRNASRHDLRAGAARDDARVRPLALAIAGEDAVGERLALAEELAQAHLDALFARRLGAAVWRAYHEDHPMTQSLTDMLDDDCLIEVHDPASRALIRGDAPIDNVEIRLVARITAYALKLRKANIRNLMRRIAVINRYEGKALAQERAARRAFTDLLLAADPQVDDPCAPAHPCTNEAKVI